MLFDKQNFKILGVAVALLILAMMATAVFSLGGFIQADRPKHGEENDAQNETNNTKNFDKLDDLYADIAVPIKEKSPIVLSFLNKWQQLSKEEAVELKDLRSKYGRCFELPNGRKAMLISTAPLHYMTQSDTLQPIDNSIVPVKNRDDSGFTNAANSFSVYFPGTAYWTKDILFQSQRGAELHLWSQGEICYENSKGERGLLYQAEISTGVPELNSIQYPKRYPGITEVFTVRDQGVKHSYVISQIPYFLDNFTKGTIEFQEVISIPPESYLLVDGNIEAADFVTDGDIHIIDADGNPLGFFPAPRAYETENKGIYTDGYEDWNIFYKVVYLGWNMIRISVCFPVEWIKDPVRSFPITIDSSSYYEENHSYDDCYSWGSELFNHSSDYLKVGYTSDYGVPFYLSYMTWHDVNIPAGSTIDYAALYWQAYDNYSNTCSFRWQFEDADDAQPCAYEYPAGRSYVNHYNYSPSYSTSWTAGSWYGISDFSAGLQDVIIRSGWASGNNVGMKWCAYNASGDYRYIKASI